MDLQYFLIVGILRLVVIVLVTYFLIYTVVKMKGEFVSNLWVLILIIVVSYFVWYIVEPITI